MTTATRSVIERLEGRMLMSADMPESESLIHGLRSHTLTSAQLQSNGLVDIPWQGQQVYAKAGEWVVGFNHAAATFTPEGKLIDLGVRFAGRTRPAPELQASFDRAGLGVQFDHYLGVEHMALIKVPDDVPFERLNTALQALPNFSYVEPNSVVWGEISTPNDPSFTTEYGLNNTGQTVNGVAGTSDADIDAPEAWDITRGYSGTVVGVIDSGVKWDHPDLAVNMWSNPGEVAGNGVDDDANGYIDDIRGWDFCNDDNNPLDDQGHGTHVAGTIAAVGDNSTGVSGVAWRARIMPLKFLDALNMGSNADAADAINYATMMRVQEGVNMRVTNNSWGNTGGPNTAISDAVQANRDAGMLFVAAAGNGGADQIGDSNDTTPFYPASFNFANVVSVAATDSLDARAGFSNFGATSVDLGAPGVNTYSTTFNNSYGFNSGTSMASPHVAGVAALAFTVDPNATYQTVKDAILNGGDALASLSGITVSGRRLNARGTLNLMSSASLVVNGDLSGAPTADTILVRLDPSNTAFIQVLTNSVQTHRVLASGVSSIDINGLGGNDNITVESAVTAPATIYGGNGNDFIAGGNGNDFIGGEAGDDTIYGQGGADIIYGGDGADFIDGQAGNDFGDGQQGNDTFYGDLGADTYYGGDGVDGVDFSGRGVALNLTADNVADDGASGEGDSIRHDVETIVGGSVDDFIGGNDAAANTLYGGGGNDTIFGGGGNDTLYGQGGNDYLDAGADNDYVDGGDANDTLYGDFGADTYFGGNGIDNVNYSGRTGSVVASINAVADDGTSNDGPAGARDNIRTDVEDIYGGSGNDTLTGSSAANGLHGGGGTDTITGGTGADSLYGDDGNDTIFARDSIADTVLNGGLGTDSAQIDGALDTNRISIETLLA
jgi:subtilisin family serine protease